MRGSPGVVVVAPGIGAGLDRRERVAAVLVGQAAAHAGEVRVEGRGVLVALVHVAAGRVGLPDLDQLVPHRPSVAVRDPAGDLQPLADGFARVLDGEVGLQGRPRRARRRPGPALDALGVGLHRALGGVPQDAGAVRRVVQPRAGLDGARRVVRLRDLLDLAADRRLVGRGLLAHAGQGRCGRAVRMDPPSTEWKTAARGRQLLRTRDQRDLTRALARRRLRRGPPSADA